MTEGVFPTTEQRMPNAGSYPPPMTNALRTLCDSLIDYAGLFPPAKLDMPPAVENFARDRTGEHAWMLSRFICPVTRLDHLSEHAKELMPRAESDDPWRVSAIIDAPLDECLDLIDAFNAHHAETDNGLAVIDAIELKARSPSFIDDALDAIPDDVYPHFEIPIETDCRGFVAALAGCGAGAKVRCGGVTPDMIPPPHHLAAFIHACAAAELPFKATAGLHHPVRAEHALTYDDDAPRGVMHGFVNVFLAASFVHARRLEPDETIALLNETDPGAFTFTDDGASWRDHTIDTLSIAKAREQSALSYGSCSFTEPVEDLKLLGWL